ncbi:hypothetical protein BDV95DRAFT_503782 [Massariosphaeria phaeospora]|uniref:F-box domain-containing protein n=1 Tax=Massariosphaeria phaeospora TaxID=100035 RepID=A0A7C8MH20_9PLEO|nr:hypothetical protein BDV95DRAFT_503782 [Massariosphaeria phaeospora]
MAPTLLSIPVELRELIYAELFSTYTVRHGFGSTSSNRASILQTCRQIHHEAWRHLPLNLSLQFQGTETMLSTLLSVDQAVVTRIRHIRVTAFPFPLYKDNRPDYYTTYYFSSALSLLPGLHLARLEVEDCFHGFGLGDGWRDVVTYLDFETLLRCDAWRELVYVTPCTDFLASGYDHRRKRSAQPQGWDALLKERDGLKSGAEVQMFITPERSSSSSVSDADASASASASSKPQPQPWSAKPGNEVIENWRIAGPEQDLKGAVTIVARRGKQATFVQTGFTEGKSWAELKDQEGGFSREGFTPYHNDMADAVGWVYGGWGRRMQLAIRALGHGF